VTGSALAIWPWDLNCQCAGKRVALQLWSATHHKRSGTRF
jgi:hypothetical protein